MLLGGEGGIGISSLDGAHEPQIKHPSSGRGMFSGGEGGHFFVRWAN